MRQAQAHLEIAQRTKVRARHRFDPEVVREDAAAIALPAAQHDDAIGRILAQSAGEYARVVELLESRGTPRYYELSRELYGSAHDTFPDGVVQVRDVAHDLYEVLTGLDDSLLGPQPPRDIPAVKAVELLNERLSVAFGDNVVRVLPPLNASEAELEEGARIIERTAAGLAAAARPEKAGVA